MKRKILSGIAITGLAGAAFGQGIVLDNLGNSGGLAATSNGQVYENGTLFNGSLYNLGVTVLGGSSAGSLSLIGTYTPLTDSKGYTGAGFGQFQLGGAGAAVSVPGVTTGGQAAFIQLEIWDYDSPLAGGHAYASYAAAQAGGDPVGTSAIWQNPTGNPTASPPVPNQELNMPSVNLLPVATPEPATMVLAGLGIASLLAFRRRS